MCYNRAMTTLICEVCAKPYKTNPYDAQFRHSCSRDCGKVWKRRQRQSEIEHEYGAPIKEILESLYAQGHGIKAIARILNMSDRTLWNWFDELGIERRVGSAAIVAQWQNAQSRRQDQSERMSEQSRKVWQSYGPAHPVRSPETRAKISKGKQGAKNPNYGLLGARHPSWKGGRVTYRGKGWRSIRTEILRRDDYTCQKCHKQFSRHDLDIHHITPYRLTKNNNPDNLLTVCKWCHATLEDRSLPATF